VLHNKLFKTYAGLNRSIYMLIVSSFCNGVAEPVNDAMITDITSAEQRKAAFSLPLQLTAVFGNAGARMFGSIMSFNALTVIILTTFVLHFTARLKPALTVAISGLFFAVGFGMIVLVSNLPLLLLSTVIWTVGEILSATNSSVYVANHAPITHRGRFNAVAPIIMWSGQGIGPPLSARFIERFTLQHIWSLCFVLSLLGAVLLFALYSVERKRAQIES
jgi:MFS family permease